VIVVNEKYDKKRRFLGFEGFKDIPEVKHDLKNVRAGFMALGARANDIIEVKNATRKRMVDLVRDLKQDVTRNMLNRETTCIFLYYAGHGGMVNNYTVCVLNEERNYAIE